MSDSINMYRCSPRQTREYIKDILYAGLVPFVRSSPGMGKSEIHRSIADELEVAMIDHRLSTSDPTDLSGLPQFVDGKARFAPFDELFPLQSSPIPKGKQGWMLFLDEINSAPKPVTAASYKLILDRAVGQHRLHDNVVISCAGNLDTDRAITNPASTAMQSRMIHIEMTIEGFEDEWMQDVALKRGFDSRIIAYLSAFPSKLFDFRPDHQGKTFCCPRTWEFMNRLIQGKEVKEENTALYAGTITAEVASAFVQFTKVFHTMVTVKDILANPETCHMSPDNSSRWATITHMIEKVDSSNFNELATYANRLPLSFRILFFRSILARHKHLKAHPAFAKALRELTQYLNN